VEQFAAAQKSERALVFLYHLNRATPTTKAAHLHYIDNPRPVGRNHWRLFRALDRGQ
jgi:hypothetical protein